MPIASIRPPGSPSPPTERARSPSCTKSSPNKFSVVQTVTTARGARTMELDPASHQLFTVTARFGPAPEQATPENPRRRPPILPDSFVLLVFGQ